MSSLSSLDSNSENAFPPFGSPDVRPGYRFITNIASADVDRALRAAKIAAPPGDIQLVLIASSELGLPLKGAALYVRESSSRLDFFWHLFRTLSSTPWSFRENKRQVSGGDLAEPSCFVTVQKE